MSTQVVITLHDETYASALRLARLTQRDVTEVLSDFLEIAIPMLPSDSGSGDTSAAEIASLSDAQVIALADLQLPPDDDARLSELLYRQQAAALTDAERVELSGLMRIYRQGLLRKAQGLAEAVRRGLRPSPPP
jgi:hypothetical protein